jgi:multicomponent K+:H+ antiporter subunit D
LNFWLPAAYSAASAPAAAMFAVLTKVGAYAVLRTWTLCFPATAGVSAHFGSGLLIWGGLATLALGAVGMLRSQQLGRVAGYSIIMSSGMVIAATGLDHPALTAGALFYLGSSTLGAAALFLLAELVERRRQAEVDPPVPDHGERLPVFGEPVRTEAVNLDDQEVPLVGRAIPASVAFLAASFLLCMLVVAGLPPLSGFVGKVAMLQGIMDRQGPAGGPHAAWLLFALVIVSSLTASIALSRAFIAHFWAVRGRPPQALRMVEVAPVMLLLAACMALAAGGEHVLRYTRAAADTLHAPGQYIDAVMQARPVSAPAGSAR